MPTQALACTLNGRPFATDIDTRMTLLELIRDVAGLTGTKLGCGEAKCGACTVLVDDEPVKSCHVLALQAAGKSVQTVESLTSARLHDTKDLSTEGLAPSYQPLQALSLAHDDLHPLQRSFWQHGAVQCGFCTAGWLMAARAFLADNPRPTVAEARRGLNGNFCRCTGYQKILEAIVAAAAEMDEARSDDARAARNGSNGDAGQRTADAASPAAGRHS